MAQTEGTDALLTNLSSDQYLNRTAGAVQAKVFTDAVNTDANGDAVFTIPAGYFTAIHAGFATVGRATTTITAASGCYIRASSLTSVTVRAYESKTTGMAIAGTAEGLEFCGAGVTINLVMFGA